MAWPGRLLFMYAALLCFNKAWSILNGIVHMRACKFIRVKVGVLY